jgi:hypothetical protein
MVVRCVVAFTLCSLTLALPIDTQKPTLEDLLARAAEYHDAFVTRSSGVSLDEHYIFIQVTAGRMHTPMHFRSDVVMLNLNGRVISLRDPYLLDNVALRERKLRIVEVLKEPTMAGWDRAQKYAAESHFRFVSDIVLALNDPTLPLRFLSKDLQPKVSYKFEGMKRVDGREAASLGFKEVGPKEATFALGTRGNAMASGRFFLDPVTGAVLKTELWANSPTEAVVSTVTYGHAADLDMWLPVKMAQTFEWKELDDVRSNRSVGAYGARLFFQANATYENPSLTPIDLEKTRR